MMKNEPTAANRIVGPIPFYDLDGLPLAAQTFLTASGEVFVSLDGAAWTAANANAVAIGGGYYSVTLAQAETNVNVFTGVRLLKSGYREIEYRQEIDQNAAAIAATATATALAAAQAAILAAIAALPTAPTAAVISDAVWDEAIADHSSAGSTGKALTDSLAGIASNATSLANVQGLLHRNARIDNTTYNSNGLLTSARRRVFASSAACIASVPGHANNADGEIQRYTIVGVDEGDGTVLSYYEVQVL